MKHFPPVQFAEIFDHQKGCWELQGNASAFDWMGTMYPLNTYMHMVNLPLVDARLRTAWRFQHILHSIPGNRPPPPSVDLLATDLDEHPTLIGGDPGGLLTIHGSGFCVQPHCKPFVALLYTVHRAGKRSRVTVECLVEQFCHTSIAVRIPTISSDALVTDLVIQPQFRYCIPSFRKVFLDRIRWKRFAAGTQATTQHAAPSTSGVSEDPTQNSVLLSYPTGRLLMEKAFRFKGECW